VRALAGDSTMTSDFTAGMAGTNRCGSATILDQVCQAGSTAASEPYAARRRAVRHHDPVVLKVDC
jgi:hypothetical protein